MSDPLPPDPYKALGLAKDTSADAVRKAFRKLALRCHPDKTKALPEAERKHKEEEFHSIKNAHDLLVDDDERRRYDLKIEREALLQRRTTYGPSKTSQNSPQPHRPQPSKSTTTPIFPARPVYEYREPKSTSHDDFSRPRYESTPRRAAPKSYDDYYEEPSPASSRRNSGRVAEERRDRREDDERIREKHKHKEMRLKEQAKKLRAEVNRERDRQIRADRLESHTQHYYHARADSESEDEEVIRFMNSGKKRSPVRKTGYPEERRYETRRTTSRRDEERTRRSRSEESSESSNSSSNEDERLQGKSSSSDDKYHMAQQYIKSFGSRVGEERDKRPSAVKTKTSSKKAPPPAPSVPADNPRRSSVRRGSSQLKPSSKVKPEIVDPPTGYPTYEDRDRRDSRDVKKSSSSRSQQQTRAATFNEKTEKLPSGLRRSQTTPVTQVSGATHTPTKQSHLRNTQVQEYEHSSGSRSTSPEPSPYTPKISTQKYRYVPGSAEEEARNGHSRAFNVVEIEPPHASPKHYSERERDREPSSYRRSGNSRSQTFQPESISRDPGRRSQAHSASNSGSGKKLYGEIDHSEISWSQRFRKEDISYGPYARRSEDQEKFASDYISRTSQPLHPGMVSRQGSYTAGVKG